MNQEKTSDAFNERFAAYLRIEPRCRQDSFATGIQARTADPLWMLARQWQTGEFQGEDAGSPIKVELKYSTQRVDSIRLGDQREEELPQNVPLETVVEQERNDIDYRERVRIGQEFERRLRTKWAEDGIHGDVNDFINNLREPNSIGFPQDDDTPMYELDHATQRFVRFMRGRVVDGLAVINKSIPGTGDVSQEFINTVCDDVLNWYSKVCKRPLRRHSPAWQPEKLDYSFEIKNYAHFSNRDIDSQGKPKTRLIAPDYRNGDLDWYSFSAGPAGARGPWKAPDDPDLNPVVATPTRIEAMGTSPRWWAFEDGNTDFGAMDVTKPDLAKLLLMDFVLISGDDWFSIPAPVSLGSLVRVDELKVWNVFGEVTTIKPARKVYHDDTEWPGLENPGFRPDDTLPELSRFDLFTLSSTNNQRPPLDVRVKIPITMQAFEESDIYLPTAVPGDIPIPEQIKSQISASKVKSKTMIKGMLEEQRVKYFLTYPRPVLFIPPSPGIRLESSPIDEVRFLRDEGANMMWGVEHTVPNGLGRPVSGFDAQLGRYQRWRERLRKLLSGLNRLLEFASPSDAERQLLENAIGDLQDHITDLSPYARPTPAQNEVPKYKLATVVPENWIPFKPVQTESIFGVMHGDIKFRRAKMLRNSDHSKMEGVPKITLPQFLELCQRIENENLETISDSVHYIEQVSSSESHPFAPDNSIPSMSRLLALDEDALIFIDEETVPRAGLRVQITKQRMRWVDGSTHVWLGRKVLTGRGEGSSGLRFDIINCGTTKE